MSAPAGPGLAARFDAGSLRPPGARADEAVLRAAHAGWLDRQAARLRAGTAVGAAPWTRPSARPAPAQAFAECTLDPLPATTTRLPVERPDQVPAEALADLLARELDGGWRLDRLPRLAGLGFRVRVKLADLAWWRPVDPADPWDAGWVRATPAACAELAERFQPRRTTLLLAEAAQAEVLAPVRDALRRRAAGLPRALRWVWVPDRDGPVAQG